MADVPGRRLLLLAYWRLVPRSRPETCKRCWRRVNPSFTAPDDLWEPVARWGVLCLPCFTRLTAPEQPEHWVISAHDDHYRVGARRMRAALDHPVIPARNDATRWDA